MLLQHVVVVTAHLRLYALLPLVTHYSTSKYLQYSTAYCYHLDLGAYFFP